MEVVSMAAEIYASAAGTIAQIWILSELFPRKQSVKKSVYSGMDFIKFLHRAFCVVAEYMAVAAWHGCDAIDVVYHA